jgi:FixJ family two-component response regulator
MATPQTSSISVVSSVYEMESESTVVFMTPHPGAVRNGIEGAVGVMTKPVKDLDLVTVVHATGGALPFCVCQTTCSTRGRHELYSGFNFGDLTNVDRKIAEGIATH